MNALLSDTPNERGYCSPVTMQQHFLTVLMGYHG